MTTRQMVPILGLAALCAWAPGISRAQSLLPAGTADQGFVDAARSEAPDSGMYLDGTKAIRENRWADAVKIFDKVAEAKGPHAAGALYWKAYAESKLGDSGKVLASCAALRGQYLGSTWIDDCGALEIEIQAKNGQPVQPQPGESDELKLLALSALMQKDPTRAKAQISEIVQGDSSERLKEGALFILGNTEPDASNPEIVRISYLEGDVRVARATKNDSDDKGAAWETAVMNLPLEEGDSLVTGKDGRVEIEFEDDSTVYLAENSALNFANLASTSGVPHTELALVSGAVTLHLDSLMPGETFIVHTPTNEVLTRYPQRADMRVSSYLDGIAVTPLTAGELNLAAVDDKGLVTPDRTSLSEVAAGETFLFDQAHKMTAAVRPQTAEYAAFDAWVADRFATRSADTAEVMQEAGLQRPIPGLAQMKGKGTFYDCQPYGKCWEPTPKKTAFSQNGGAPAAGQATSWGMDDWFPCMPWGMGYGYGMGYLYGSGMGYMTFQPALPMPADMQYQGTMDPLYAWAVCHAGYWLPQGGNGRYAWVVGRRIHHHCPVKWVHFGRTVAAIPIHPKDVKGQPPLNREHGFTVEKGKDSFRVAPVKFDGSHPLELMKEAPREFRNTEEPKLARTEAPHMEAHALKDVAPGKPGLARAGVPLTFNRQQGFMTTHQVVQGGRTVAVNTPLGHAGPVYGGHGSAPATGFGASGGSHGGGGGGFHGGSVSASSSGGAAHGGSVSSGSISVSSAPAASSSASSSGSHK